MKKLCLLIIMLLCLTTIPLVDADGSIPSPVIVNIQSAKIVSEGAYFYMDITSTGIYDEIIIQLTPDLKPIDDVEILESNNITLQANGIYRINLSPYQTVRFHFHAPYLQENEEFKIYNTRIKVLLYLSQGAKDDFGGYTNPYFKPIFATTFETEVISLKYYKSLNQYIKTESLLALIATILISVLLISIYIYKLKKHFKQKALNT